jgi:probable phosphoglycerate mutase
MKLILTRHGETVENLEHVMQGHMPGRLSDKGIQQAKRLALRLKDEKIDFIYSSDLARAADTAKEIARYHPGTPVRLTQELRERDIGEFTGRNKKAFGLTSKDFFVHQLKTVKGESIEQLVDRAKRLLEKLAKKHRDDTVLFVAHSTINKAILTALLDKPVAYMHEAENVPNTAVSVFEIRGHEKPVVLLLNCTEHLGNC